MAVSGHDAWCLFDPCAMLSLTHARALQVVFTGVLRQIVHSAKFNKYLLNTYSVQMSKEQSLPKVFKM